MSVYDIYKYWLWVCRQSSDKYSLIKLVLISFYISLSLLRCYKVYLYLWLYHLIILTSIYIIYIKIYIPHITSKRYLTYSKHTYLQFKGIL